MNELEAALPAPPAWRRLAPVAVAIAIGAAGIGAAFGFTREPPPPESLPEGLVVKGDSLSIADGAPQWKSVRLGRAEPAGARWTEAVPARVVIDESHAAKVGAPLAGRVVDVRAELGQTVKAGQPLFTMASADVAAMRADVRKAKVELEAAQKESARVQAMVEAKALAEKEGIAAADRLKEAELSFDLAGQRLASLHADARHEAGSSQDAGSAANEFTVRSPRAGVVVAKNVLPSQVLSADSAEPLMVIADLDTIWILADVFESDAAGLREGTRARVSVPSLAEGQLDATVDMVSSVVDPERHAIPVRLRLSNTGHYLKPNVYAQVRFEVPAALGMLEVDATAIVSDGATQYVYVRDADGAFRRKEVVAGPARGGKTAILSGLSASDLVVQEGAILLDNQIALAK